MKTPGGSSITGLLLLIFVGSLGTGLTWPRVGEAQDKAARANQDLAAQLRELQAKIARLEAALPRSGQGMSGMSGMGGMMGMGAQKQGMGGTMGINDMTMGGRMGGQKQGMGGMMGMEEMMSGMGQGGSGSGMGMMDDNMEMMGMMNMMGLGSMDGSKSMGSMKVTSALPGFPGASHIYHIGSTGFFLDHPQHITLTTEQQTALNGLKQKALLDKADAQRKIDEAEQALWQLTAADQPDAEQIEAQVQAIEKHRGEQRMAFIRSVGEAAKVLTDEQRQVLLGTAPSQDHKVHSPTAK